MSVKDDIARLAPLPPADRRLDAARNPNAIRSKTGLQEKAAANVNSEEVTVTSTDGLFTFTVRVVKA